LLEPIDMRRLLALVVLAVAGVACSGDEDEEEEDRPVITTSGLHQACPDSGCAAGQECVDVAHPEPPDRTCEIVCEDDLDCPAEFSCNVPPLIPDMIAYICERR
jgi:hypothetical protein